MKALAKYADDELLAELVRRRKARRAKPKRPQGTLLRWKRRGEPHNDFFLGSNEGPGARVEVRENRAFAWAWNRIGRVDFSFPSANKTVAMKWARAWLRRYARQPNPNQHGKVKR